ncbi:MAG: type II toxin-antitoxin system VapC family toxin [Nocardioidaceae bacterium]
MTDVYLDTSAAVKLLVEEPESVALATFLDQTDGSVVACLLLETELRRFAVRHGITQSDVTRILGMVALYDMPRSLYYEAGILPGRHLRSLDALHLAAAVRIGTDSVLTYDGRMQEAAAGIGLEVIAGWPTWRSGSAPAG